MEVNMPVAVEQSINTNTSLAKKEAPPKDKLEGFEQALRNSQSKQEKSKDSKVDQPLTEKVGGRLEEEIKTVIEAEDSTIEELILTLLRIYKLNTEDSKVDTGAVDYVAANYETMGDKFFQDIDPLVLGTSDSNNNPVLQMVSDILSTDKLPVEIREVLQEYLKGSVERQDFTLKDYNTYGNSVVESLTQANLTEGDTLRNRLIGEIKTVIEAEDSTIEELILTLLRIYKLNTEDSKVDTGAVDYVAANYETMGDKFFQDIDPLVLGTSDSNNNPVLQMVSDILSTDKLPVEIREVLQEYLKGSVERQDFTLKDYNTYGNSVVESLTQANLTEGDTLRNRLIGEIKTLLKARESDEPVKKLTAEAKILDIKESLPTDLRKTENVEVKARVSGQVAKNSQSYEFRANSFLNEGNNLRETNNLIFVREDKNASNNNSILEKEEAFLKGILEDKDKGEGKINLFMNYLKVSTSAESPNENQSEVVVSKVNFVNDIIKTVKFMETSSLKELKVSINPKEIGELLITVTMESGKMKANIEANSKDSYNLLMSNLEDIKKTMASNEVSLQDINVSINQGDTTFFKDSSQRQENQNDSSNTGLRARKLSLDDDVIIAEDSESLIDSQINMLA